MKHHTDQYEVSCDIFQNSTKDAFCISKALNMSHTTCQSQLNLFFQVNGVSEETDNLKTETVSREIKDEKAVSQGEEAS